MEDNSNYPRTAVHRSAETIEITIRLCGKNNKYLHVTHLYKKSVLWGKKVGMIVKSLQVNVSL